MTPLLTLTQVGAALLVVFALGDYAIRRWT